MHTICKPDAATFNCLVVVYCRLGKVREAQNMVEVMMRAGQSVELPTYSAVICVLWCSGVVPLQRHALQLFDRACKQGLYRLQVREQVGGGECKLAGCQCLCCFLRHQTLFAVTELMDDCRKQNVPSSHRACGFQHVSIRKLPMRAVWTSNCHLLPHTTANRIVVTPTLKRHSHPPAFPLVRRLPMRTVWTSSCHVHRPTRPSSR